MIAADGRRRRRCPSLAREPIGPRGESRRQGGGNRVVMLVPSAKPADFVRKIAKLTIKIFDLVDVVAGGDGFSGRRNAGIDPTNGRADRRRATRRYSTLSATANIIVSRRCRLSTASLFPTAAPARCRSTLPAIVFDVFPATSNNVRLPLGGRSAIPQLPCQRSHGAWRHRLCFGRSRPAVPARQQGDHLRFGGDPAGEPRTTSCCDSAPWRAIPKRSPKRGEAGMADLWVLVDGQVRFRRREINGRTVHHSVVVPIDDERSFPDVGRHRWRRHHRT